MVSHSISRESRRCTALAPERLTQLPSAHRRVTQVLCGARPRHRSDHPTHALIEHLAARRTVFLVEQIAQRRAIAVHGKDRSVT